MVSLSNPGIAGLNRTRRRAGTRTNEPTSLRTLVRRALPWLFALLTIVAALRWTSTSAAAIGGYAAYWALALTLPGTLVFRAVRGSRGNLPEDLGFGAVTGLVLELPAWALAVGTGTGGWLWLWPVAVVAAFVGVPALRPHWRIADPRPLPLAWSWIVAGVIVAMTVALTQLSWAVNPLPPSTHSLYGDTYYYWANAAELTRTIAPQRSQAVGVPLHSHWLPDAHHAAAHLISRVPLSAIMLRVGDAPFLVVAPIVIAGLARQVSRVWWSGPVAAAVAGALPATVVWPRFESYPVPIVAWHSPTMTYSVPVVVLVAALLVDVVRARRVPPEAWGLLGAGVVVAAGSKPSNVPILAAGLVAAAGAAWVTRRRVPGRILAALALTLGAIAVTAPTMAGGRPGAGFQLGGWFTFLPEYIAVIGQKVWAGSAGALPPSLALVDVSTRYFLPLFIACWVLSQVGRLIGVGLLAHPAARRDPAAWLLAGATVAGLGAALTVNHVSASEGYFWFSAAPLGAAATGWLLAIVAPPRPRRVVGAGLVIGAVGATVLATSGIGRTGDWPTAWLWLLAAPVVTALAWLGAAAGAWRFARSHVPGLRGSGTALVLATVIGLGGYATGRQLGIGLAQVRAGALPSHGTTYGFWVEASEMRAALWIARHAAPLDVVATNVHCETIQTRDWCSTRSFWVSALTERRVVLEGWAYQEESLHRHGADGFPFFAQPPPDPDRLRVNDAVFTAPTADAVRALRTTYGARWLLADARAAPVSGDLGRYATVRFTAGPATVYELP